MKKIVIAGSIIGALLIVSAVFILRSKRRKLEKQLDMGSPDVVVPAAETTSAVIFPLKRGSGTTTAEKNSVKVVQRYINAKLRLQFWIQLTMLDEDGIFGPLTEAALQRMAGVKQVSYSLYQEMLNYLYDIPKSIRLPAGATDPAVQKNNL